MLSFFADIKSTVLAMSLLLFSPHAFGQQSKEIPPIMGKPVFKAKWSGEKRNGQPEGFGTLYQFRNEVRYIGNMRNGRPEGFGIHFGDYIVEGEWHQGNPTSAQYYLREVEFNSEDKFRCKTNGWRYRLVQDEEHGLIPHLYTTPTTIDSTFLSRDSLYTTKRKPYAEQLFTCSARIFYLGDHSESGFGSYSVREYLLVICPSGNMEVIHSKAFFPGRSGPARISWFIGNLEIESSPAYPSFENALHGLCGCDQTIAPSKE